jgi:tetratricopeptide (TPR) repeat protein
MISSRISPFPPLGLNGRNSVSNVVSPPFPALPDVFVRNGAFVKPTGALSKGAPGMEIPETSGQNPDQNKIRSAFYMQQGDLAYRANRFPEALEAFNKAILLNERNYRAYNKRGVVRAALRDYLGAIADYTVAIALEPGFYNAWLNRGNLWAHVNNNRRALADYAEAIRINPGERAAYDNRSELYSAMGRHDLAAADKAAVIGLRHAKGPGLPPFSTAPPPRFALVLANDDYPGREHDLEGGPLQDAHGMTQALQACGFQVMTGTNLTGPQTRERIGAFVRQLREHPGAVSLIYYSGHGGSINGNNYLLPVNFDGEADADFRANAVSVDDILQELKSAKSAFNLLFLDACRTPLGAMKPGLSTTFRSRQAFSLSPSGSWPNGGNAAPPSALSIIRQWETEPGPGLSNTWIEYASRPEKPALQSGGRGLYTKYLLYYMMQPDLNLEDVSMYTSYALEQDPEANREDQHARTQTDLSRTEDLAEAFYFLRPTRLPVSNS